MQNVFSMGSIIPLAPPPNQEALLWGTLACVTCCTMKLCWIWSTSEGAESRRLPSGGKIWIQGSQDRVRSEAVGIIFPKKGRKEGMSYAPQRPRYPSLLILKQYNIINLYCNYLYFSSGEKRIEKCNLFISFSKELGFFFLLTLVKFLLFHLWNKIFTWFLKSSIVFSDYY